MNWKNVRLIFQREVRDQLRDRRTLFMIAVLPLLLYPAMGIGMVQLTVLFSEQPRTVVLLGEEFLPPPELLDRNRFVANWLPNGEQDAQKLEVITDTSIQNVPSQDVDPRVVSILQQAESIREKLPEKQARETSRKAAEHRRDAAEVNLKQAELNARKSDSAGPQTELNRARTELVRAQAELVKANGDLTTLQNELGRLFAASQIQVLVLIPQNFDQNLARVNQQLAAREKGVETADYERPIIVHNNADEKSMIAYSRVKEALDHWEDEILRKRLEMADLPSTLPSPIKPVAENLALDTQIAANLWSKLFPALLVIMSVTGAFYPAIDLCAGEKERGTMETLLICPASRTEIVMGKFFTVCCFSIATALLNLLSMGLTGQHMVAMVSNGSAHAANVSFPSFGAMLWVVTLLLPLAGLFSALCLALATFARSSKEGQYYLTPLLMVTLGITVFCMSPGVEITPFYSVMPVAGVALLLKGLLLAPLDNTELYGYAIPVLVTTFGYGFLAIWWAIDQFQREDVLFREAERFELGLWIRHLLRDKEPTPTFTEAAFCFVLIMLLQFSSFRVFQANVGGGEGPEFTAMLRVLMIQQVAIIASPALFMGVMLTTSLLRTFRIRRPRWDVVALSALLAVVCHPLSLELNASLSQWFFPPLPDGVAKLMQGMTDPNRGIGYILLAFAVAPAICEELAFRGFILSGFHHTKRTWLAISLSSLAFGIMHMIPQQVFNATLLGLVLGAIAIRGGSLLPCMLFHLIFNSLAVLHGRFSHAWQDNPPQNLFIFLEEGQIRYHAVTLVFAAGVLVWALRYLLNRCPGSAESVAPMQHAGNPISAEVTAGDLTESGLMPVNPILGGKSESLVDTRASISAATLQQ